jgi:hypothetical protein
VRRRREFRAIPDRDGGQRSSLRAAPPKLRVMSDFEPEPNTPDHAHWLRGRRRRRIEFLLAVCTMALVTGMVMTFYEILTRA